MYAITFPLQLTIKQIKQALSQLIEAYKTKEKEFIDFQQEYNIKA